MKNFEELIQEPRTIITDGAMGTPLLQTGLLVGEPVEVWVLKKPQTVMEIHRSFIAAGAEIIITNTLGANRIMLETSHLADRVVELNRSAAVIARQAAGEDALVFGDIGTTGKLLEPLGPLTFAAAVEAYKEQATALLEGGVQGLVIETLSDLKEARAAFQAAREATRLPIVVTMSFDTHGRTMMGVKPAEAARELMQGGVEIMGANCGRTLSETLQAIQEMRRSAPQAILWAKPNAGLPRMAKGDQAVYDVTPVTMAEYALKFAEYGVRFMGGCCGSTPEHIRAIAETLSKIQFTKNYKRKEASHEEADQ